MPQTSITIRPYRGQEEGALLALWNAVMTHDRITPAVFRTKVLLDLNFHPEGLLVAEQADGRLAGFVLSLARRVPQFLDGMQPTSAWITAFGVDPALRRQGIGSG